ncbi:MAG: 5-(carboxyamino)imidazole ribonucleotide synthase [Actinomycetes bacterium]
MKRRRLLGEASDVMPQIDDFPIVGIVGGGEIARMMAPAGIDLGVGLRLLASDPLGSAAPVYGDVRLGAHDDKEALLEFAKGCAVVTFGRKHVPSAHLQELRAAGIEIRPGWDALLHAQDKITMRLALSGAGLPSPLWTQLPAEADLERTTATLNHFAERAGWPIVLRAPRGIYDGWGSWIAEDLAAALAVIQQNPLAVGSAWLLEEWVDFVHELSAQVARSPHGQAVSYPVVKMVKSRGIHTEVVAPAPDISDEVAVAAQDIALRVAEVLHVTGMLAVELFDTGDRLLINEIALRPHDSGNWTLDGAVTSQFENHLRAILDLPLGSPMARAPFAVTVNILGTERTGLYSAYRHVLARDPGIKVHMYGKPPKVGRRMGHVTAVGEDLQDLLDRARHAADYFSGVIDE